MRKAVESKNRVHRVAVYIYDFSDEPKELPRVPSFFCEERRREIEATSDATEKARKFYSWELLLYALKASGVDAEKTVFAKNAYGKWGCADAYFSISHTAERAAVAVCEQRVGLDVELFRRQVPKGLFDKIANVREKEVYRAYSEQDVLRLWTAKESMFKECGGRVFYPERQDTLSGRAKTFLLNDVGLILSVSSKGEFAVDIKIVEKKNGTFCESR